MCADQLRRLVFPRRPGARDRVWGPCLWQDVLLALCSSLIARSAMLCTLT